MGVGPGGHRPANSASEGEMRPTRYASPGPTSNGVRDSWTAATGRRAGAEAAGVPPRDPKYPRWGRAGREAGGLPQASAARREGRGDLALPLALGRRRRRHFAFHSVSLPPHSAAGFPDVGISRRRLRGGPRTGGFCPLGRLESAACGLLPSTRCPLCEFASVSPRRPRLTLPR